MPGLPDTAVIVLLALILFGPKRLPVLARQLGKLMADFRRASNEFRTQMEEELRISEQADRQKQVAAIEAAAPASPAIETIPEPEHPHMPPPESIDNPAQPTDGYENVEETRPLVDSPTESMSSPAEPAEAATPLPIATSGELSIMPPATGLPIPNTSEPAIHESTELEGTAPAHHAELETETLHG
jgi:sec-independent protein translocase protein TatB